MRYPYVVILKKNSERTTDLLSTLLCLFAAFCFLFFAFSAFYSEKRGSFYFLLITALVLITGVVINAVLRRRHSVRYRYWLLAAAVGWLGMTSFPWIAVIFFLLAFLEYQTKRPLEIGFSATHVVINTLFKRSYDWMDFNNVILKDGLLTLDFKNNRLLQKEVLEDDDEDDATEEEFNDYCRSRLAEVDPNKILSGEK